MLRAILLGFVIGFAAVGMTQATGTAGAGASASLMSGEAWVSGGTTAWHRLVRACSPRPAYPGLA